MSLPTADCSHMNQAPGFKLREYQEWAVGRSLARFRPGTADLITGPTGCGKTQTFAATIREILKRGMMPPDAPQILVMAHREELIDQTYAKLYGAGIIPGIIRANDRRTDYSRDVQVASIDTLVPRLFNKHNLSRLRIGALFIDECHHAGKHMGGYRKIIKAWPGVPIFGYTATPFRTDNEPLGDIFNDLYAMTTPSRLLADGNLVPMVIHTSERDPDLSGIKRGGDGEFNEEELSSRMVERALTGCLVSHWKQHGIGRPTLGFAVRLEDANEHARMFKKSDIKCEVVDAKTENRGGIIDRLCRGRVDVVFNVGIFTEGTDIPPVSCILDARPTQSLGLYMQMMGRGSRPSPDTGKRDCIILDHAGNFHRHGDPMMDRTFKLHSDRPPVEAGRGRKVRSEDAEPVKPGVPCRSCGARVMSSEILWVGATARCPRPGCGAEMEFKTTVRHRPGRLRPVNEPHPIQGSFL